MQGVWLRKINTKEILSGETILSYKTPGQLKTHCFNADASESRNDAFEAPVCM